MQIVESPYNQTFANDLHIWSLTFTFDLWPLKSIVMVNSVYAWAHLFNQKQANYLFSISSSISLKMK